MNYTFILGALCGATVVLVFEAVLILACVFKGVKEGILNEKSESDSLEI